MLESTKPKEVVCLFDQAIDGSVSDVIEYGRNRDISKLKFKEGKEPVRFFVDRMSRRIMLRYVSAADSENERFTRAFCAAVGKVTGLPGAPEWRPAQTTDSVAGKLRLISDEELERFSISDILEIGSVAYWHSFLREGSEVSYPLLASSATAYDMTHPGSPSAEKSGTG